MIYSGSTAPTSSQAIVMTGTGTQITTSAFNSASNDNKYVRYRYQESDTGAIDSLVKETTTTKTETTTKTATIMELPSTQSKLSVSSSTKI